MGKTLLLHMCCGPCAIMPIRYFLEQGYSVTGWFMNPNVQPLAEYLRRREAAGQCAAFFGIPILYEDATWNITEWLRAVQGRDTAPERCTFCCESRVKAAFDRAQEQGFDCVSTSLLYSVYQPHEVIRDCGLRLAEERKTVEFLYEDFRRDWKEGIERCREMGLYRQPYCGCVYSESDRYQKKLQRCMKESQQQPA